VEAHRCARHRRCVRLGRLGIAGRTSTAALGSRESAPTRFRRPATARSEALAGCYTDAFMSVLPTLIVERTRGTSTAALGAWVRCGSAHEPDGLAGVTHVIEHLLLRRCGGRGTEEIAALIDSLGGDIDAFTTREQCAVTAHVPAERFVEALELVFDAVFRPVFTESDLNLEQGVVRAEFELVQDSPAEVAAERALEACWDGHPLARPVLGRRESVRTLNLPVVASYHARHFIAENLLFVAVGDFDERRIAECLAALPRGSEEPRTLVPPRWCTEFVVEERERLEQIYVNLVFPGLPADHREALALGVLQQLLGSGASSRLFRELRDRLGLVYDVDSSAYSAAVAGVLEVTFSTPLEQAEACWSAVLRILEEVGAGKIADSEVELARQALQAGVVLGSEGNDALLEAYAGEFLSRRRRFDPTVLRRELDDVTPAAVRELARRLVRLDMLAGAACGPVGGVRLPSLLRRRVA